MRIPATLFFVASLLLVPVGAGDTASYVAGSYDPITGTSVAIACHEGSEPEIGGICVDLPGGTRDMGFHINDQAWGDEMWWLAKAYTTSNVLCMSTQGNGGGTIALPQGCHRVHIHLDSTATQGTITFWY